MEFLLTYGKPIVAWYMDWGWGVLTFIGALSVVYTERRIRKRRKDHGDLDPQMEDDEYQIGADDRFLPANETLKYVRDHIPDGGGLDRQELLDIIQAALNKRQLRVWGRKSWAYDGRVGIIDVDLFEKYSYRLYAEGLSYGDRVFICRDEDLSRYFDSIHFKREEVESTWPHKPSMT